MTANGPIIANNLLDAAVSWLRERLPGAWEITPTNRAEFQNATDGEVEAALDLKGPSNTYATIAIQAKRNFGPRDVDRLLGPVGNTLRILGSPVAILIVSDWLSGRTQELLRENGFNYIDLTGNALVSLEQPTLYLQTQGASKNPDPPERGRARLQGPKAERLIRALADFRPPYGIRDLAAAAGLAASYTSNLIQALDDDALIERDRRGGVVSVDVPRVLRRWTQTYDLFKSNTTTWGLARAGVSELLDDLRNAPQIAITGSFAATRLASVAAPRLLVLYTAAPAELLRLFDILPVDDGANLALLQPADDVVWQRTTQEYGFTYVAPSQAAIDCLTGNGRMPSEGEALLDWMTANEDAWRRDELQPYQEPGR